MGVPGRGRNSPSLLWGSSEHTFIIGSTVDNSDPFPHHLGSQQVLQFPRLPSEKMYLGTIHQLHHLHLCFSIASEPPSAFLATQCGTQESSSALASVSVSSGALGVAASSPELSIAKWVDLGWRFRCVSN